MEDDFFKENFSINTKTYDEIKSFMLRAVNELEESKEKFKVLVNEIFESEKNMNDTGNVKQMHDIVLKKNIIGLSTLTDLMLHMSSNIDEMIKKKKEYDLQYKKAEEENRETKEQIKRVDENIKNICGILGQSNETKKGIHPLKLYIMGLLEKKDVIEDCNQFIDDEINKKKRKLSEIEPQNESQEKVDEDKEIMLKMIYLSKWLPQEKEKELEDLGLVKKENFETTFDNKSGIFKRKK